MVTKEKLLELNRESDKIQNLRIENLDLTGVKFNQHFENVHFTRCIFKNVDLSGLTFKDCSFVSLVDAESVDFSSSQFYSCRFEGTKFRSSIFTRAVIVVTTFDNVSMKSCNISDLKMIESIFRNSKLGVYGYHFDIRVCEFQQSHIQDCEFLNDGVIHWCTFNDCGLISINLATSYLDNNSFNNGSLLNCLAVKCRALENNVENVEFYQVKNYGSKLSGNEVSNCTFTKSMELK